MALKSLKLFAVLAALALAIFASPASAIPGCTWSQHFVNPYWFGTWTCPNCQVEYVDTGGGWRVVSNTCGRGTS
jgi:hypothetical protein